MERKKYSTPMTRKNAEPQGERIENKIKNVRHKAQNVAVNGKKKRKTQLQRKTS